jgi:hypothetical protein
MEELPSTRDQECPTLSASPEAMAPTFPPEPDFREPDRHKSTQVRPVRTRGACSAWNRTTRRGRPIEALRREQRRSSSRSKRCETNVGHRGGLQRRDGVATTPTDQHALPGDPGAPNTTHSRLERVETHLRRNRVTASRSTTSRRTNRNLEATDWTRPKSCPD